MRKLIFTIVVIATALGGLWGIDVLSDRAYQLEVFESAPLYSLPPHEYPKVNPIQATLKPGQAVHVLRLRYGKDFQAFRVETDDGIIGWVIGGEGVKVIKRA
jgi:hypothetical protein